MHGMGNALKTALLLGSLSALILLAGQWLGGTTGLLLAGLLALGSNGVSYFYSDKLALRAMRAERVTPEQAPRLHATMAELVSRRGLPMPRVYISPSSTPTRSPPAAARRTVSPLESSTYSTSASCAGFWGTRSATSATATFSSPQSRPDWPA